MLAELEQHAAAITALIGLIVWLVRLEGKTLNNDKRLCHLEAEVESMHNGIQKELTQVKEALARIEGYLKAKAEFND
jgi:hypothetical protein